MTLYSIFCRCVTHSVAALSVRSLRETRSISWLPKRANRSDTREESSERIKLRPLPGTSLIENNHPLLGIVTRSSHAHVLFFVMYFSWCVISYWFIKAYCNGRIQGAKAVDQVWVYLENCDVWLLCNNPWGVNSCLGSVWKRERKRWESRAPAPGWRVRWERAR